MKKNKTSTTTRRKFISGCAACGACVAMSPLTALMQYPTNTGNSGHSPAVTRKRIRIIYSLHAAVQPVADWPNIGFDFDPAMKNINSRLIKQFPQFEFIPSLATGKADAEKIMALDKKENVSGYIVYQMNPWIPVVQVIANSGKPVLYADFKYSGSGGFLINNANFMKNPSNNVGFVSSPRIEDLLSAVKCFEVAGSGGSITDFVAAVTKARTESTPSRGNMSCRHYDLQTIPVDEGIRRMEKSKILAVGTQPPKQADPVFGIPLEYLSFEEVNKAWETANRDDARAVVEKWHKTADSIIDVPDETLQSSAAFYLGMKSVLTQHEANAITIDCLGGFYGGSIHAYPCLGFHELCNEGLVGACECDIRSTATMVAFSIISQGRPGIISDPVIDTSRRQIIYAHCVAPNKVFGPDGPENQFMIMTHSEDRQGASVRSILPVDYLTTTLMINQERKEILMHQAKSISNDPDDRACRTKLCAEPLGDIEKLFRYWGDWGWHRVTFYGDLKESAYAIAEARKWKVIEEA